MKINPKIKNMNHVNGTLMSFDCYLNDDIYNRVSFVRTENDPRMWSVSMNFSTEGETRVGVYETHQDFSVTYMVPAPDFAINNVFMLGMEQLYRVMASDVVLKQDLSTMIYYDGNVNAVESSAAQGGQDG